MVEDKSRGVVVGTWPVVEATRGAEAPDSGLLWTVSTRGPPSNVN